MKKSFIILGVMVVAATVYVLLSMRSGPASPSVGPAASSSKAHDAAVEKDRADSKSKPPSQAGDQPLLEMGKTENQQNVSKSNAAAEKKTDNPHDYGMTKPVRADANPQVASVAAALKNKTNPERLSPLIQPKPFDAEAYLKDPTSYLHVVEPGRCFQSKNPSKDVPKIQSLSPQFQEVAQGKSVTLRVQALAKYPVTFTSFDLGKFQNELTSITVEANESGIAETKFFGESGTIDEVKILAASPMTSGQIQFLVNVTK